MAGLTPEPGHAQPRKRHFPRSRPSLLVYAGYIGETGDEQARGIAVDAAGTAYVVGTRAPPCPPSRRRSGLDLIFSGSRDVFVAKIKADGSDLVYLGYIGGAGDDFGESFAVDSAGNVYITGRTDSDQTTFPVKVGTCSSPAAGRYPRSARITARAASSPVARYS